MGRDRFAGQGAHERCRERKALQHSGRRLPSGDWIFPTESRKSRKVCVATVHFRLFLNGQGGNMSIGCQVSRRSQLFQKMEEDDGKVSSWFQDNDGRLVQPASDASRCLSDWHGVFQYTRVGHETNEAAHHDPWYPDGLSVIDFNFPPFLCGSVLWSGSVVGVNEEVDIRDYHLGLWF